jgi:hypothetical protein
MKLAHAPHQLCDALSAIGGQVFGLSKQGTLPIGALLTALLGEKRGEGNPVKAGKAL